MSDKISELLPAEVPITPQLITITAYIQWQTRDHSWLFESLKTIKRINGLEVQSLHTGDMINASTQLRHEINRPHNTAEAFLKDYKPLARLHMQWD